MTPPLRLAFFGSDPIALPLLHWLAGEGRGAAEIAAVFTQPDRPAGRGQQVRPNAIKGWALAGGLPVFQPAKLTEEVRAEFAALGADAGLVLAYGHILSDAFIGTPRLGLLNLHASLLPKYRGASPIQAAVAGGERETGVSLMRIVRELDAGPVADEERVPIGPLDTAAEVTGRLAEACVPLLARALPKLARGELAFAPQDAARASFCRKLRKEDGAVNFRAPAAALAARINGLFPWPGCSVEIGGQPVKFGRADPLPSDRGDLPGTVLGTDAEGVLVAAGGGVLRVRELQRPGGRMLPAGEFLRGFPIAAGTVLPSQPMPELVAAAEFDSSNKLLFSPSLSANIRRMLTLRSLLPALALALPAFGQTAPTAVDIANMREDIQGLTQRVNDLGLRVEQLEHENGVLHQSVAGASQNYATVVQLNDAIADLNRTVQAAIASSKSETLQLVGTQMEKLARQTNAALDSLTKGPGPVSHAVAPAPAAFGGDYPKEGVSYTVQKGDTLALIAKKTGAKFADIVNANKLADPSRIQIGQTLFIPGGK